MRDEIHAKHHEDGAMVSKVGLHEVLKMYADLEGVSMATIEHEELQQLKEFTKQYALEHCGIEYDKDKRIQLNFKR
jgi:hypothetical protein